MCSYSNVKTPLRIAIDARQLGSKQASGIGVMTEELLKHIVTIDKFNQYTAITSKDISGLLPDQIDNLFNLAVSFAPQSFSEQLLYPLLLIRNKYDLIHYTNFNSPIWFKGVKSVVTVHDLTPWLYPNSPRQRNWLYQQIYRYVLKHSCLNAAAIVVPSIGTKEDIIKYLKINPNKIHVVYESVSKRFKDSVEIDNPVKFLSKYNINSSYILYVGQLRQHKNLINLIKAFALFCQDQKGYQLVIAGKRDPLALEIETKIKELNLEDKVIITGYIADDEIANLYKLAKAFVFPSLYEGFGIPPLEAMASGIPVLSSNASVMPEILGNAALYFNPKDFQDIANSIGKMISSPELQKSFIDKGFKQVDKYSFYNMAKQILSIYLKI